MIRHALFLIAFVGACASIAPRQASAIPVFAHRYGLSCQACHTAVPHLSEFGEAFLERGYRLPGVEAKTVLPIAIKINLNYTSEPDASGLPRALVDEVELLTGGHVGRSGSYFAEAYVIDGGRPGAVRDAWYARRIGDVQVTAGQFTLALPVDPETFRETSAHYALYDQTVGANPFRFFDPKQGVSLESGGNALHATLALLGAHDPASGLRSNGVDRMIGVRSVRGALIASAYRYDGTRPVVAGGDRFWRQGIALAFVGPRLRLDATVQNGNDAGLRVRSSGGFLQARYAFTPELTGIVRYDGTSDTAFARALIVGASRRVARNARFTLEDQITHTSSAKHTLTAAYLFAY